MSLSDAIARRLDHLQRIEADPALLALELAVCTMDVVHWCRHWCWTFDPREPLASLPLNPFPKQADYLLWLVERERKQESGLVEKSRDMGITWHSCVYAVHGWLFRPGFAAGFGSRKLELVDRKGDPDSIFEKIRFLVDHLPAWMLPNGYHPRDHATEARLINPQGGASITGEGGDNIGRGGRKSIYFVDEAAYLEHPHLVERSLSQTTRCRIDVSTPNGPGNPFATKRFSGTIPVFSFHWRDDPRKSDAWYAEQKRRFDPVTVAQEIDMDYTASIEGITIPAAWVRAAVNLTLPPVTGPVIAGFDVGEEGPDLSVLIARQGPKVFDPVAWGKVNTTEGAWRARDEARRLKVDYLNYDAGGPGMGIKGTWETAETPLPFVARGLAFGGTPSESYWPDGQTSQEKFLNLRAEMWWRLRACFERVYEYTTQKIAHAPEDMISIPNCPQLIAELSQPLTQRTETGKVKLESKDSMKRRGVKSPDYGDALALAFADTAIGPWEATPDPRSRDMVSGAPEGVFGVPDREGGKDLWEGYQS